MTTAPELVRTATAAGAKLSANGDKLSVTAPRPLAAELVEKLRAAKAEILQLLAAEPEISAKASAITDPAPTDENQDQVDAAAKFANPAKPASAPSWDEREDERAAIVEPSPLLLADGRRLHRFRADDIPSLVPANAAALLDQARWYSAVLVADGCELVVVERPHRTLPAETLRALKGHAGGVIAMLRGEHRERCKRVEKL
jgi:hypothetical protein